MGKDNVNGSLEFSESNFWLNFSTLKNRLNALKRKNTSFDLYDPLEICEEVKEILDFDEEENLSFLPNKIRKLNAGSELCKDICALQRHFSSLVIDRVVSEVLEEDKHEEIARRIISRRALQAKTEKYFLKQALETIRNSVGDESDEEMDEEGGPEKSAAKGTPPSQKDTQPNLENANPPENVDVVNFPTSENLDSTRPETARASEKLDNLRMSKMSVGTRRMTEMIEPLQDITLPEIEPGQRQLSPQSNLKAELKDLEEIVGQEFAVPLQDVTVGPDVLPPDNDDITLDLERLPPVITPPTKRRRFRPRIDKSIIIPDYSERAIRLNESVVVERVQVYEGPPAILQAFTLRHVLQTPAVNNGYYKPVRSAVLERLYTRHQKTEKMQHIPEDFTVRRSTVQESVIQDTRHPFRLQQQKSNIFDLSAVQPNLREIGESANQIEEQLEKLVGIPVSKILEREAPPRPPPPLSPSLIRSSDPWLPPRSPRLRNLQGKRMESPPTEPWFKPIPVRAPNEKWREFNYVRTRLEEVWKKNTSEERASLRQILEDEWNKENMMTLLIVLDKMSLKREIIFKGDGENLAVYPFRIPYVTEKQYSLLCKPPQY